MYRSANANVMETKSADLTDLPRPVFLHWIAVVLKMTSITFASRGGIFSMKKFSYTVPTNTV